jgi:hypothetical protein
MRSATAATTPRVCVIVLALVLAALAATVAAPAQARKAHARGVHTLGARARKAHARSTPTVGARARRACEPARAAAHPRACAELRRRERREAEHRRLMAELLRHHEEVEKSLHAHLAPACEDGSTPVPGSEGGQACAGGGEPQCPSNTRPKLSREGTILYCLHGGEPETPFEEGQCEGSGAQASGCGTIVSPEAPISACDDGSKASADGEGDYACADGSEPSCPAGYELTISGDGSSLVCDGAPTATQEPLTAAQAGTSETPASAS